MPQHDQDQAERRNRLREPQGGARPHVRGGLKPWQIEHRMGEDRPQAAANSLHNRIRADLPPGEHPADALHERNCRIEVGSTHWPKESDQCGQDGHGRPRVRQERKREVPPGQACGHHPPIRQQSPTGVASQCLRQRGAGKGSPASLSGPRSTDRLQALFELRRRAAPARAAPGGRPRCSRTS
jgi:hypothetical protein